MGVWAVFKDINVEVEEFNNAQTWKKKHFWGTAIVLSMCFVFLSLYWSLSDFLVNRTTVITMESQDHNELPYPTTKLCIQTPLNNQVMQKLAGYFKQIDEEAKQNNTLQGNSTLRKKRGIYSAIKRAYKTVKSLQNSIAGLSAILDPMIMETEALISRNKELSQFTTKTDIMKCLERDVNDERARKAINYLYRFIFERNIGGYIKCSGEETGNYNLESVREHYRSIERFIFEETDSLEGFLETNALLHSSDVITNCEIQKEKVECTELFEIKDLGLDSWGQCFSLRVANKSQRLRGSQGSVVFGIARQDQDQLNCMPCDQSLYQATFDSLGEESLVKKQPVFRFNYPVRTSLKLSEVNRESIKDKKYNNRPICTTEASANIAKCQEFCINDRVYKTCGCILPARNGQKTHGNKVPICGNKNAPLDLEAGWACSKTVRSVDCISECEIPCKYLIIAPKIHSESISKKMLGSKNNSNSYFAFYFDDFTVLHTTHSYRTSFWVVISNVGGTTGIFTGLYMGHLLKAVYYLSRHVGSKLFTK